jgi:hypothetical protein
MLHVILGRISCISHGRRGDHGLENISLEILQTFLKDPYEKVKTVDNCSANDTEKSSGPLLDLIVMSH